MTELIDGVDGRFVPAPGGRVIVGYDGSPLAAAALEWAAEEAVARSAPLRIISASTPSNAVDFYDVGARRRDHLTTVSTTIERRFPGLRVEQVSTVLDPRDALIGDVMSDDLLVVGASTGSAAKRVLVGSVARSAARRSLCPVVIIHEPVRSAMERIVVGVDGSRAAAAAIDWACSESRFRGSNVDVVHAWNDGLRLDADAVVDEAVGLCRSLTPNPVSGHVIAGRAVDVLVDASRTSDLIAVGSRGRSGFKTMLFGSVALAIAAQAVCPTAVTHPLRLNPDRSSS